LELAQARIGIVGLGYVGLPLAVEFGRRYDTLGFDIDPQRIAELREGRDHTREITPEKLRAAARLRFSGDVEDLRACRMLATVISPGDIVVFESTVYPGTTEEVCVGLIERNSPDGLKFNRDFFCGYSPERINPGDHARPLTGIVKITSGSTPEVADFVDALYASIIEAGTHKAPSIRVAEAAKVIENIQRDVNIALVNELALIFDKLDIDTGDVLAAAGTKWNFLPFRPGLVGGHCIGVDPYYLTHKSAVVGYHPELILAARRINNRIGVHVAQRVMRLMQSRRIHVIDAKVLVLGLTFKENCPDLRNSRVVDIIGELRVANADVQVYDPWADPDQAEAILGVRPVAELAPGSYDAVVLAVAHDQFKAYDAAAIRALGKPGAVVYDVKSAWPREVVDDRL
jgi:UDP-N-acetyl-D-glucosamine/UDP-N-acetyl-D-galactosamine dehydrogenase